MTIKPMGPSKRTKVPGDKDCCPLLELTGAREREQGVPGCQPLS